jgi:NitT/TauT family transport system substrate-binding protein
MIDDRGELWHSASRQLRAAFGSPFSGGELVDYAVRNLGFVAVKSQGAASQVWLRPSFAATRALNSLRNWLQQAQVERLVITLFEDGWRGGRQDELVGPAQTDQRIDALVQRKLLSTAWSAAGASGDSVACVPCRMGRMRPVVRRRRIASRTARGMRTEMQGDRSMHLSGQALCVLASTILFAGAATALHAPSVRAQGTIETITIQDYPGTSNMLFRIAKAKGYCEAHGIKCELKFITSGPLGAQALLAGSIDVGFFPASVQINAMLKGARLKTIASGAQKNILTIVMRNDVMAPNSEKGFPAFLQDLRGKKIGVPARAAGVELDFLLLAREAGLKDGDFTFVANGSPNTAYGSLISGQVDANVTFDPSGTMCEVLKTCRLVYRASEANSPATIVATHGAAANFVITDDFIARKPNVVSAILEALRDAEAFIQKPENFDEALAIAKTFFSFEMERGDEILAAQLKRVIPSYRAGLSRSALRQIADNMLALKQLDAPFDTTQMVYDKALE